MTNVAIDILPAFRCLFTPKRYKIFYGGRGGAKSHNFARALLVLGAQKKMRIVCGREIENTTDKSIMKLFADIIYAHGLDDIYTVMDKEIRGANGTEIFTLGLRHNIKGIKSLEAADVFWAEEADAVPDVSWEMIIPTMRKDGSEIWASFNPTSPDDPVYERFVKDVDTDRAIVKKVSWRDNKFISDELRKEIETLKTKDPEAYAHVYEGEFDTRRSGAVYARLLLKAREDGRICSVPYDPSCEVFTAWDLGYSDCTAIWWLQFVGRELRWLDYYENSNESLEHYVKVVKDKPYNYRRICVGLPHDGGHNNIRGDSIAQQLHRMGLPNVVLERDSDISVGIETLRATIGFSCFDKEKCKEGIRALEKYSYEWDKERKVYKKNPQHDWTSHGSDAARYAAKFAAQIKPTLSVITRKESPRFKGRTSTSWMAR
jgi:phage terminase large subunit